MGLDFYLFLQNEMKNEKQFQMIYHKKTVSGEVFCKNKTFRFDEFLNINILRMFLGTKKKQKYLKRTVLWAENDY